MNLAIDIAFRRGTLDLAVDLDCTAGMTALFGPSGSGKTTLLHLINGLLHPERGRIVFDGAPWWDGRAGRPAHRRPVATLFQEDRLFPDRSVEANLRFGWRLRALHERRIAFDDVVDLLELAALLPRRPQSLSGGERRRVALGRALLTSPRLLLLDEPLSGVDGPRKAEILAFLRRIHTDLRIPLIYVSHDLSEILQMTSQLVVLCGGRVLGHGPYHQIVADPAVFEVVQPDGLENVLVAEVEPPLPDGLQPLRLVTGNGPGPVILGSVPVTPGRQHIAIRPEDIAIASGPIRGVSLQNQVPGVVVARHRQGGRVLLEVDIGVPILAEVSERSCETLGLVAGCPVVLLFKAVAVRTLGPLGRP